MKNKQTEMNNTITEFKNILEVTDSRITEVEEQINDLEDRMVEITAKEQNKRKRMKRIEDSLRDLWDNIKRTSIQVIGVATQQQQQQQNKKKKRKALRTFLKKLDQDQEASRVPYRRNPRRNTLRHIIIKLKKTKHKKRILKAAREKQ